MERTQAAGSAGTRSITALRERLIRETKAWTGH